MNEPRTVVAHISAESIVFTSCWFFWNDGMVISYQIISVGDSGLNHSILIGISQLEDRFGLAETNSTLTLHVFQLSNLTVKM